MRLLPAFAALAVAAASPAAADDFQPEQVVSAISLAQLKQVVGALGHKVEAEDAKDRTLRATDGNGTSYVLTGAACDIDGVPGCRGVAMQVLVSANGEVPDARLAEANLEQAAVSTRYYPDTGAISVTRYLVLDGGVTLANVAQNIGVLLALTPEVIRIVTAK
jgi:hypothetical protein